MRLDRWFRERYPGLGHGALQKLLRTGQVRVDGARAKANQRIESGQEVRVPPMATSAEDAAPKKTHERASDADRRLIEELTDAAVRALDAPIESVRVIIREVPGYQFGAAGKPKSPPPPVDE